MRRALFPAILLAVTTPVLAEPPAVAAQAVAPVDPARMAIAVRIAVRLLPDGTYEKLMGGSMQQMMASTADSVTQLPLRSLAGFGGMSEAQVKALGPATLGEVSEILDPAYKQRMQIVLNVMMREMGRSFTQFEPALREGMAEAYAGQFDEAQLKQIDAFYATPTGSALAAQSMTIMAEPPVMRRLQTMMPKVMATMPDIMKVAIDATSNLPKPRTPAELSPAELERLAALLGIEPGKVKS